MAPVASGEWPTAGLHLVPRAAGLALSSPLTPLPSLPSISPWRFKLELDGHGGEGAVCVGRKRESSVRMDADPEQDGHGAEGPTCIAVENEVKVRASVRASGR